MSAAPIALLKLLAAAAGHVARPSSPVAPGQGFDALLKKAESGALESGLAVRLSKSAGVSLSDEQLQRISAAADRAEAQGATRALVMIDGMVLKLDVGVREITGRASLSDGAILTGIDSVIAVPSAAGAPSPEGASADLNRSLLSGLAARRA